eukprot:TRINITY_DN6419_c0_g1_i1.p1 TRINITY_DN6419_c0_g1~~TRINITY_DN6419_c0_g1_i1.p1  ORF type:complete len:263 (+),score=7.60 TRINITY_DN6419_c0_g1_i1:99-887(+)
MATLLDVSVLHAMGPSTTSFNFNRTYQRNGMVLLGRNSGFPTKRSSPKHVCHNDRGISVQSCAQSGEKEAPNGPAQKEPESLSFRWVASGPLKSFDRGTVSSGGLVPFRPTGPSSSLALQSLGKEEALGVVMSAAMGTGWQTLTGMVGPSAQDESSDGVSDVISSASPRRTVRVDFTCNKCGHRSRRAINPHAYKEGTVFVQCQGCNVYHKLVDNLNLFHELKGAIFHGSDVGDSGFGFHESVDVLGLDGGDGSTFKGIPLF